MNGRAIVRALARIEFQLNAFLLSIPELANSYLSEPGIGHVNNDCFLMFILSTATSDKCIIEAKDHAAIASDTDNSIPPGAQPGRESPHSALSVMPI